MSSSEAFARMPMWWQRRLAEAIRTGAATPAAAMVLWCLEAHRNRKTGDCFPGLETITDETALSRNTVGQAIRSLEAMEILQRSKQRRTKGGKPGTFLATRYILRTEDPSGLPEAGSGGADTPSTAQNLGYGEPVHSPKFVQTIAQNLGCGTILDEAEKMPTDAVTSAKSGIPSTAQNLTPNQSINQKKDNQTYVRPERPDVCVSLTLPGMDPKGPPPLSQEGGREAVGGAQRVAERGKPRASGGALEGSAPAPEHDAPKRREYPADFEQWWRAYPRTDRGKWEALGLWRWWRDKERYSAAALLRAAQNYAIDVRETDPRYHQHATTFLSRTKRTVEEYMAGIPGAKKPSQASRYLDPDEAPGNRPQDSRMLDDGMEWVRAEAERQRQGEPRARRTWLTPEEVAAGWQH